MNSQVTWSYSHRTALVPNLSSEDADLLVDLSPLRSSGGKPWKLKRALFRTETSEPSTRPSNFLASTIALVLALGNRAILAKKHACYLVENIRRRYGPCEAEILEMQTANSSSTRIEVTAAEKSLAVATEPIVTLMGRMY